MTEPLYREDAYQQDAEATVVAVNDRGGIILDRTVFYPTSGGQPGDTGTLSGPAGDCPIATTVYDGDRTTIVHVAPDDAPRPAPGDTVKVHVKVRETQVKQEAKGKKKEQVTERERKKAVRTEPDGSKTQVEQQVGKLVVDLRRLFVGRERVEELRVPL